MTLNFVPFGRHQMSIGYIDSRRCIGNVSIASLHAQTRPRPSETNPQLKGYEWYSPDPLERTPRFGLRIRRLGVRIPPNAPDKCRACVG